MLTYQVEKLYDILEEVAPLFEEHWEEVAWYKEDVPFSPDYRRYLTMENVGLLHVVTARDKDRLVGYDINFVTPHPHHSKHTYAVNDVIFLHPSYRRRGNAEDMVLFAESKLKELGVSVITLNMRVDHPFIGLVEKTGFTRQEYLYSKYIGG